MKLTLGQGVALCSLFGESFSVSRADPDCYMISLGFGRGLSNPDMATPGHREW
ncbi:MULTISPECIES: hypothetical protein [Moorena]|uniref:hypothetical protein n=1 Tax=Moorena TaxID=1155738 RepID=UPI0012B54C5F|nr:MULTISPECIES: hypothetical protein [Moorena]NEQ17504.1 hypothetical protein [Moorena sp. SIO3E2]NEP32316.1 hypothetical protein [Moorena sp. SIO3B2]NEP67474.1 hypothetical protein [Moorena sp. SIO3A5]NER89027.1 hypothetical protein [Moorena sp. SIO3A2]NES45108.1 hypothetical protein [Moorena sp. SIO2C4]